MRRLNVFLNGEHIGQYNRRADGRETFEYSPEWLENGHPVSRQIPLDDRTFTADTVESVFDNLLPDDSNHRSRIAEKTRARGTETHDLLYEIGRNCVGSFQFLPEGETPNKPWSIEAEGLSRNDLADLIGSLDSERPHGMDSAGKHRKSIAGQHEKTGLLKTEDGWADPIGTTPSTHIFKPQDESIHFGLNENEYFCMQVADRMGLDVPEVDLELFRGYQSCLVIERFDRERTTMNGEEAILRVHQEDFCQALGRPNNKKTPEQNENGLEPLMLTSLDLLQETDSVQPDQTRFIHGQIFQFFMGAEDGHLKNYSWFLDEQSRRMTPFYDISSADPYNRDNPESKEPSGRHAINMDPYICFPVGDTNHRRTEDIHAKDWLNLADHCQVKRETIKKILQTYCSEFPDVVDETIEQIEADVDESIYAPIRHGVQIRCERIKNELSTSSDPTVRPNQSL